MADHTFVAASPQRDRISSTARWLILGPMTRSRGAMDTGRQPTDPVADPDSLTDQRCGVGQPPPVGDLMSIGPGNRDREREWAADPFVPTAVRVRTRWRFAELDQVVGTTPRSIR